MSRDNFYVNDGLGGADSLKIAIDTQRVLVEILHNRAFNLKR